MANEKLLDFFANIFRPGVQPEAVNILNGCTKITLQSLLALIIIFCGMVLFGRGNIHVYIMLGLAVCLLITVNWFLSEYYAIKKRQGKTIQTGTKKKQSTNIKTT